MTLYGICKDWLNPWPSFKVKSLFQIIYYQATDGRHKTQTHIMNAHTVYDQCMSRKLITAFNNQCMCINYKSINSQWFNLGKCTVLQSLPIAVFLSSHLHTQSFMCVALDSSDNAERKSLSGRKHTHDAAITVFQLKSSTMKSEATMSSTDILAIKNLEKLVKR